MVDLTSENWNENYWD